MIVWTRHLRDVFFSYMLVHLENVALTASLNKMGFISKNSKQLVIEVAIVSVLWVVLFEANKFLLNSLEYSHYISWIFLPAALRIVSVLVLGSPGAIGLFIGALITNHGLLPIDLVDAITLSTLSALCPLIALVVAKPILKIKDDLSGFKPDQLYGLAIIGSLLSCVPHHIYFWASGKVPSPFEGFAPMLVGDILGATIALGLTSFAMKALKTNNRTTHSL